MKLHKNHHTGNIVSDEKGRIMKIIDSYLNEIQVIQLDRHDDSRGYFVEIYNADSFHAMGIDAVFVQDNCSFSMKRGTIRGFHFQKPPYAQAKLIRCTEGSFFDIAIDVRKGSPTYGKASCVLLKKEDDKLVYIPRGFAHGVAIVEDNSAYNYKVDNVYNGLPQNKGGLSYNYDKNELDWNQLLPDTELILSERDIHGVSATLDELNSGFVYQKG